MPLTGRVPSASEVLGVGYEGSQGYPLLITSETKGTGNGPGETVYVTTTWKWDGGRWLVIAEDPSMVGDSRPVYDPATGQTISMGGCLMGCPSETWSWDGKHWINLYPATPPPVGVPSYLAFDPVHHVMVLEGFVWTPYGGSTWLFDGIDWSKVTTPVNPPPRDGSQMIYDPDTRTMLLYGGRDRSGTGFLADTWTWDGKGWTQQHPATNPPAGFAQLVYDPKTRRVVMLVEQITEGSKDPLGAAKMAISSWSWDGRNWTSIEGNLPEPGFQAGLTYDPSHEQLVFFEGTVNQLGRASQTWVYAKGSWQRRS